MFYNYNYNYTQMYNNNITPYTDKRMEIIKNYDIAINRGSKMAISEKAKFISKLQILTHDLNYYNADYDLEQFITKVSNRVDNDNLSILLYGPENAGMKEFAEKLFSTMNKKYECISSHHLNARSNLLKVLLSSIMTIFSFSLSNFLINSTNLLRYLVPITILTPSIELTSSGLT